MTIRPPVEQDARCLAEVQIAAWRAACRGVMSNEYLDGVDFELLDPGYTRGFLWVEKNNSRSLRFYTNRG